MTIRERGITRATQVAWEVAERLRDQGHEAYVISVNNVTRAPKRRRPKKAAKPQRRKVEAVPT